MLNKMISITINKKVEALYAYLREQELYSFFEEFQELKNIPEDWYHCSSQDLKDFPNDWKHDKNYLMAKIAIKAIELAYKLTNEEQRIVTFRETYQKVKPK
jgi:hypothetical protein